jgi:hypothetical protein
MAVLDSLKRKNRDRTDAELERELAELRAERESFASSNQWTKDDVAESVERWLAAARGTTSVLVNAPALGSGSRDADRAAVSEVVLSFIVRLPAFTAYLEECVNDLPDQAVGFSALSRRQRDDRLGELDAKVRELELELRRRALAAHAAEAEAALEAEASTAA